MKTELSTKESLTVLCVGFTFAAIYVGSMALFPIYWAIGNLILLPIAIFLKIRK